MTAAEQQTLDAMWEFMRAQESHRRELREIDEQRWERFEKKLAHLDDIDERIEERVAACRTDRAHLTEPAVAYVHKAMDRQRDLKTGGALITKVVAVFAGITAVTVAVAEWLFR